MSNPSKYSSGYWRRDEWLDDPDNAANPHLEKGSPALAALSASSGYSEDAIVTWLENKRKARCMDPRIQKAIASGRAIKRVKASGFGVKHRCSRCGSVEHTVSDCTMSLERREELEAMGEAYVKEKNRSSEYRPVPNCPGGPGCAECADPAKICQKKRTRKTLVARDEKGVVDDEEAAEIFDTLRERPLRLAYEGPHKAVFDRLNDEGVTTGDVARLGGAAFNSANAVVRVFKGTLSADDVCLGDEDIIALCELGRNPPLVPKGCHVDGLGYAPGEVSRKELARRITGYAAIYVENAAVWKLFPADYRLLMKKSTLQKLA